MSATIRCPGCDRPRGPRDLESDHGFARCRDCDTVFLMGPVSWPLGEMVYKTKPVSKPRGISRTFVPAARSGGVYRGASNASAELELRWSSVPQNPTWVMLVLALLAASLAVALAFSPERGTAVLSIFLLGFCAFAMDKWWKTSRGPRPERWISLREQRLTTGGPTPLSIDADTVRDVRVVHGGALDDGSATTQGRPVARYDVTVRTAERAWTLAAFGNPERALYAVAEIRSALGLTERASENTTSGEGVRVATGTHSVTNTEDAVAKTKAKTNADVDAIADAEALAEAEAELEAKGDAHAHGTAR